ncbi:hypothetical protein ACI0FM_00060 [Paenochrobactrum sp. BZR 588]|uniref:hypothetical protein n=1 Tax=unclassified Paenochrobactrum TaxID=2639760 RepID=UPI0038527C0D
MTNPVQIPDAAVQAVIPHLSLGFEVKKLEWEKTHSCNGILSAKTHFGTYFISSNKTVRLGLTTLSCPFQLLDEAKSFAQADFECRVGECHVPRPDIKTIIDEIRNGTRQGFLNEGDQPEASDAELSCPHCGGSGHIDDVVTKPVDVAAVHSSSLIELLHDMRFYLENMGSTDETDAELVDRIMTHVDHIRALSAEPAQGEQWRIGIDRLPTLAEAQQAAMILRACNGADLGEWTKDIFPCDDMNYGLEALINAAPTSEAGR